MFKKVDDGSLSLGFSIEGLQFEPNLTLLAKSPTSFCHKKLISSPGPLISDFVTHEKNFHYSTYGIHVGQDDRLTFMGDPIVEIDGFFVDCREGSATLHRIVRLRFKPSLERRLVIPRGVAHTFDNLESIVTRDEPVWYVDHDNPAWNMDNDLVSVSRSSALDEFPIIRPNRYTLPDEAHLFLSKISQSLLENPKSYLARFSVQIAGAKKFVMLEPKQWANDDRSLAAVVEKAKIPGVEVRRNRYALTGGKSFTLVPNTNACVSDVLLLKSDYAESAAYHWHARTRKIYTFLNNEGAEITLSFIDLRENSETFGQMTNHTIISDPRINIRIEQGIAYRITITQDILIRCEHEVFVDKSEPRTDIPMFGQDLVPLSDTLPYPRISLPTLQCPHSVVYKMAKFEQHNFT
ncbi:dTDP-4-dehydrorhamnose 3,5-epimerase family protein [Pseudomonas syringae]|uniref:dTDP-4-dehydrorhamnose 3,5-epimerase family protein n=1 Tax=Pseudomonas syringae TaxID=317 RepID=UPI0023F868D3|nr:dTDP-4-dehydrorhamnose 3,5-epimerase family protein [Pseudomonas syringae]MDF5832333.1 dTDP-4-dehydrorhamnose 3,5-epimerase family protein [Pseudomonas syringae]